MCRDCSNMDARSPQRQSGESHARETPLPDSKIVSPRAAVAFSMLELAHSSLKLLRKLRATLSHTRDRRAVTERELADTEQAVIHPETRKNSGVVAFSPRNPIP